MASKGRARSGIRGADGGKRRRREKHTDQVFVQDDEETNVHEISSVPHSVSSGSPPASTASSSTHTNSHQLISCLRSEEGERTFIQSAGDVASVASVAAEMPLRVWIPVDGASGARRDETRPTQQWGVDDTERKERERAGISAGVGYTRCEFKKQLYASLASIVLTFEDQRRPCISRSSAVQ